jgi:hypothetical protein
MPVIVCLLLTAVAVAAEKQATDEQEESSWLAGFDLRYDSFGDGNEAGDQGSNP